MKRLTLAEWAGKLGTIVNVHPQGSKYVVTDTLGELRSDAFHLSDYVCTSVCGIVFWFTPR